MAELPYWFTDVPVLDVIVLQEQGYTIRLRMYYVEPGKRHICLIRMGGAMPDLLSEYIWEM